MRSSSLSLSSLLVAATIAAVAPSAACSSSSSSGGGSSGSSGGSDAGGTDSGADAAPGPGNCTTFVDHSASDDARVLTWDFSISTDANRCTKIKVGQTVTFKGDLVQHPLAGSGGDTPNPIDGVDMTGKVTFPKAGTFGFHCEVHPAMIGAIEVVP